VSREKSFNILRTVVAMIIATLVAFTIILLVSENPLESIKTFIIGPFTSLRYLGNIVEVAIPLTFSGLAMAVLFQTSLFNLGAEGIFFLSGALGALVSIWVPLPGFIHPLFAILVGGTAGAAVMLIPGILKAKFGASELVTSLMLNNILLGVGCYILNNVMRDPNVSSLVSFKFAETALLAKLIPGTKVHTGLLIAIGTVIVVYIFLYKSKWGYELRMTGINKEFAEFSGINIVKVIILAHIVAGFLSGMGGVIENLGMHKRFEWTALPGYGFDGAMIAMLAGNNPIGVVGAALFVAYLRIGADLVNRFSDIPTEMISILQCVIILLISAERFLHKYKQKWIEKEAK